MKTLAIIAALLTVLAAPSAAWAQPPRDPFENMSKRDLYDAGQRYRRKLADCGDDLDISAIRLAGATKKLATRTSTAVRALVVPPVAEPDRGVGIGTAVVGGVALVTLGIVVGFLAASEPGPSVVVTK